MRDRRCSRCRSRSRFADAQSDSRSEPCGSQRPPGTTELAKPYYDSDGQATIAHLLLWQKLTDGQRSAVVAQVPPGWSGADAGGAGFVGAALAGLGAATRDDALVRHAILPIKWTLIVVAALRATRRTPSTHDSPVHWTSHSPGIAALAISVRVPLAQGSQRFRRWRCRRNERTCRRSRAFESQVHLCVGCRARFPQSGFAPQPFTGTRCSGRSSNPCCSRLFATVADLVLTSASRRTADDRRTCCRSVRSCQSRLDMSTRPAPAELPFAQPSDVAVHDIMSSGCPGRGSVQPGDNKAESSENKFLIFKKFSLGVLVWLSYLAAGSTWTRSTLDEWLTTGGGLVTASATTSSSCSSGCKNAVQRQRTDLALVGGLAGVFERRHRARAAALSRERHVAAVGAVGDPCAVLVNLPDTLTVLASIQAETVRLRIAAPGWPNPTVVAERW